MKREQIEQWARKAGAWPELSTTPEKDLAFLERFAEVVAAHEREQETQRHRKFINLDLDGVQKEFLISAAAVGFVRNFHAPQFDSRHFADFANDQRQIAIYHCVTAIKSMEPPSVLDDNGRKMWALFLSLASDELRVKFAHDSGRAAATEKIYGAAKDVFEEMDKDKTPPAPLGTEGKPA